MPSYFVVADNGSKYGPADEPTLQQWINEHRLLPASQLEDAATGQRVVASDVAGLSFPQQQVPASAPTAAPSSDPMFKPAYDIPVHEKPSTPASSMYSSPQQGPWTQAPSSPYYRGAADPSFTGPYKQDKVNGIILIVLGSLATVLGLLLLVGVGFLASIAPKSTELSTSAMLLAALPILLTGVGSIPAGIGMMKSAKWGFILTLAICGINLLLVIVRLNTCGLIVSIYYVIYCITRLSGKTGPAVS